MHCKSLWIKASAKCINVNSWYTCYMTVYIMVMHRIEVHPILFYAVTVGGVWENFCMSRTKCARAMHTNLNLCVHIFLWTACSGTCKNIIVSVLLSPSLSIAHISKDESHKVNIKCIACCLGDSQSVDVLKLVFTTFTIYVLPEEMSYTRWWPIILSFLVYRINLEMESLSEVCSVILCEHSILYATTYLPHKHKHLLTLSEENLPSCWQAWDPPLCHYSNLLENHHRDTLKNLIYHVIVYPK